MKLKNKLALRFLLLMVASISFAAPVSAFGPVKNFNIVDYIFVVDGEEPEIAIIGAERNNRVGYIRLDDVPAALIVSEKDKMLIATDVLQDRLWFASPEKRRVLKEIQLEIKPHLIAIDPDEEYVVIADWNLGVVQFISLPDGKVIGQVDDLIGAHELRFNTSTTGKISLYVSIVDRPEIAVVDVDDMIISRRIALEGEQGIIQLAISGTIQFAIAIPVPSDEAKVHLIDMISDENLGPLQLPAPASRAYFDSFGRYIFLTSAWDGRVWVFDVRKRKIIETLSFDGPITGIAPGFLGMTVWLLSAEAATVWGVNLEDFKTIETTFVLESGPFTITSHDQTGKVFVSIEEEMRIISFDTQVLAGTETRMNVITLPDRMPMLVVAAGALAFCQ